MLNLRVPIAAATNIANNRRFPHTLLMKEIHATLSHVKQDNFRGLVIYLQQQYTTTNHKTCFNILNRTYVSDSIGEKNMDQQKLSDVKNIGKVSQPKVFKAQQIIIQDQTTLKPPVSKDTSEAKTTVVPKDNVLSTEGKTATLQKPQASVVLPQPQINLCDVSSIAPPVPLFHIYKDHRLFTIVLPDSFKEQTWVTSEFVLKEGKLFYKETLNKITSSDTYQYVMKQSITKQLMILLSEKDVKGVVEKGVEVAKSGLEKIKSKIDKERIREELKRFGELLKEIYELIKKKYKK